MKDLGYYLQVTMDSYGFELPDEVFPDEQSFIQAAKQGYVMTVNRAIDDKIEYRSNCNSIQCLISLIKGYRSYPKYRNEDTINDMAKAFDQNKPMKMPIVLQLTDTSFRVMGGNTRMDMAFIKGVNPKVLVIDIRKYSEKI
jgi:hypothetical protein